MEWFCRTFSNDPQYNPDNLLLIYEDTTPIAAAAAWQTLLGSKKTGLVHMVGVDRKYQGRGLGRVITLLVLHRLKERGFHSSDGSYRGFPHTGAQPLSVPRVQTSLPALLGRKALEKSHAEDEAPVMLIVIAGESGVDQVPSAE